MKIFNNFWILLNQKKKIQFSLIIFLSTIMALLETLGIALVIPFATSLLKPQTISEISSYLNIFNLTAIELTNLNLIYFFCISFVLIFLIKNIFIYISTRIVNNFALKFKVEIFRKLVFKILNQNYLFFIKNKMQKILIIIYSDIDNYSSNVVTSLISILSEIIIIFSIIILMIYLDIFNGLLLIIPIMLFAGIILKKLNKSIKFWAIEKRINKENLMLINFHFFAGIKELLLYGGGKQIIKSQENIIKKIGKIDIKNSLVVALPKIILEQTMIVVFVVVLIFMINNGVKNDEILIILSFYLAAAYRIVPSFNKIFVGYQNIKKGLPSYKHIKKYLELESVNSIMNTENENLPKFEFKENINYKNISFAYNDKNQILKNLNFTLKKNDIIGITGDNGSGKTTLVNILIQLIEPSNGEIEIDNINIKKLHKNNSFKNLFSITSQDTFLFNGSILENIIGGFKNDNFSEKRVDEAIKFAKLEKTIKELPNGINTDIGSNIQKISSGQKQRIAIAKAYYLDKEIMIFDEATNSIDEQTEREIFENFKLISKKKTILIISHNKQNFNICNKIFKIVDGKLILN